MKKRTKVLGNSSEARAYRAEMYKKFWKPELKNKDLVTLQPAEGSSGGSQDHKKVPVAVVKDYKKFPPEMSYSQIVAALEQGAKPTGSQNTTQANKVAPRPVPGDLMGILEGIFGAGRTPATEEPVRPDQEAELERQRAMWKAQQKPVEIDQSRIEALKHMPVQDKEGRWHR